MVAENIFFFHRLSRLTKGERNSRVQPEPERDQPDAEFPVLRKLFVLKGAKYRIPHPFPVGGKLVGFGVIWRIYEVFVVVKAQRRLRYGRKRRIDKGSLCRPDGDGTEGHVGYDELSYGVFYPPVGIRGKAVFLGRVKPSYAGHQTFDAGRDDVFEGHGRRANPDPAHAVGSHLHDQPHVGRYQLFHRPVVSRLSVFYKVVFFFFVQQP